MFYCTFDWLYSNELFNIEWTIFFWGNANNNRSMIDYPFSFLHLSPFLPLIRWTSQNRTAGWWLQPHLRSGHAGWQLASLECAGLARFYTVLITRVVIKRLRKILSHLRIIFEVLFPMEYATVRWMWCKHGYPRIGWLLKQSNTTVVPWALNGNRFFPHEPPSRLDVFESSQSSPCLKKDAIALLGRPYCQHSLTMVLYLRT